MRSPPRRVPLDHRPERLGQEHAAAPAGHARRARRRRSLVSRAAASIICRCAAATRLRNKQFGMIFQFYHLLPELTAPGERAVAADDRRGRVRLLSQPQAARRARHATVGNGRPVAPAEASPQRTIGWRNAARGHRPGAGRRTRKCCWPTSRRATSTARTGEEILRHPANLERRAESHYSHGDARPSHRGPGRPHAAVVRAGQMVEACSLEPLARRLFATLAVTLPEREHASRRIALSVHSHSRRAPAASDRPAPPTVSRSGSTAQLYDKEDAKISVYDHGLLYGDGVFEGLRSYGGKVFRLEQHLDRLWNSAKAIRLEIPMSRDDDRPRPSTTRCKANGLNDGYIRADRHPRRRHAGARPQPHQPIRR